MTAKKISFEFVQASPGSWGMFKTSNDFGDVHEAKPIDLVGTGNPAGIGERVEEILRGMEADENGR